MIDTALAEGIEKGRMEGRMEEKREIVKNAIRLGINDEQISLLTGLSVDEIREVRKNL
jgi:predicted transposase/invertase (TIGR01784 family)